MKACVLGQQLGDNHLCFCIAFVTRVRKKKHNLDPNYLQGDSLVVGCSTVLVCLTVSAVLQLIGFSSEDLNIFFQTKKPHGLDLDHRIPQNPSFLLLWPHTEPGNEAGTATVCTHSGDEAGREMVHEGQESSMTEGSCPQSVLQTQHPAPWQ